VHTRTRARPFVHSHSCRIVQRSHCSQADKQSVSQSIGPSLCALRGRLFFGDVHRVVRGRLRRANRRVCCRASTGTRSAGRGRSRGRRARRHTRTLTLERCAEGGAEEGDTSVKWVLRCVGAVCCAVLCAGCTVIVEQFDDEVDVRQEHTPAAVPLQLQRGHRVTEHTTSQHSSANTTERRLNQRAGTQRAGGSAVLCTDFSL
jgi:hypothetical protein